MACKTLGKVIRKQRDDYMQNRNYLSERQHDFKGDKSCATNLLDKRDDGWFVAFACGSLLGFVCVHIFVYLYIYLRFSIYKSVYRCSCVCAFISVYTCTLIYAQTTIFSFIHIYISLCVYIYVCILCVRVYSPTDNR